MRSLRFFNRALGGLLAIACIVATVSRRSESLNARHVFELPRDL
jgi:hypothetical protein